MAVKFQGGLGKGLDELFGEARSQEQRPSPLRMIEIGELSPNRDQPRRSFDGEALASLAESMRQHGVITPITVCEVGENRYRIIAGERRYRAARLAGLTAMPAFVVEADELKSAELALAENLQREDLNPIEEAEGIRSLMAAGGYTQEQAAERVGRSRPAVANALRLLELEEPVKNLVVTGALTPGHARALLGLPAGPLRAELAARVAAEGLSVRETERLVKAALSEKPEKRPAEAALYAREYAHELTEKLGRAVKITPTGKEKGRITLEYADPADLEELVARLL